MTLNMFNNFNFNINFFSYIKKKKKKGSIIIKQEVKEKKLMILFFFFSFFGNFWMKINNFSNFSHVKHQCYYLMV